MSFVSDSPQVARLRLVRWRLTPLDIVHQPCNLLRQAGRDREDLSVPMQRECDSRVK